MCFNKTGEIPSTPLLVFDGTVNLAYVGFKWTEVFCPSYAKIRLSRSPSTPKAADDRKPQMQPYVMVIKSIIVLYIMTTTSKGSMATFVLCE